MPHQVNMFEKEHKWVWLLGEFVAFIRAKVDSGLRLLIVTGCTTTCCVRESATSIAHQLPGLQLCVDLSSCAVREENTWRRCQPCLDNYLAPTAPRAPCVCLTGDATTFTSPLDRTIYDLGVGHVIVNPAFEWAPYLI